MCVRGLATPLSRLRLHFIWVPQPHAVPRRPSLFPHPDLLFYSVMYSLQGRPNLMRFKPLTFFIVHISGLVVPERTRLRAFFKGTATTLPRSPVIGPSQSLFVGWLVFALTHWHPLIGVSKPIYWCGWPGSTSKRAFVLSAHDFDTAVDSMSCSIHGKAPQRLSYGVRIVIVP